MNSKHLLIGITLGMALALLTDAVFGTEVVPWIETLGIAFPIRK